MDDREKKEQNKQDELNMQNDLTGKPDSGEEQGHEDSDTQHAGTALVLRDGTANIPSQQNGQDDAEGTKIVFTDLAEIKQKAREYRDHRRKVLLIGLIVIGAIIALYIVYSRVKTYTSYRVVKTVERADSAATHFKEYGDGLLKYSNDGASYIDSSGETIWNQGYEMQSPMVSICGDYIGIADKEGETIYIMDQTGLVSQVDVTMPVLRMEVCSLGNVALLMEEEGTSYIAMYSSSGEEIAEGAIHVENTGTPLDIALSQDGKIIAASILDLSAGKVGTVVNFYNFGATGQKETDNIVSTYSYEDTVISDLAYVSSNRMIAFSDKGVITYTGTEKPKEANKLEVDGQIESVFYDDSYFGLAFAQSDEDGGRKLTVYDMHCKEVSDLECNVAYDNIMFLKNHEICMFNDRQMGIYTMRGKEKFLGEFDSEIYMVSTSANYRSYTVLVEGETEVIRLRLFNSSTGSVSE